MICQAHPVCHRGFFEYYRQRVRSFSDLAIYRRDEWTLTGDGAPQRIIGLMTTPSLGAALRVQPARGRWFTEKEAQDRVRVVMISDALWRTHFGSDPNIVGRKVRLDGIDRGSCRRAASDVRIPRRSGATLRARAAR